MIVAIVKTDNSVEIFHKAEFNLDFIQKIVGGWIEPVHLPNAGTMYCNEEGKIQKLPHNSIATIMLELAAGITDDWIAGDVVVVGPSDEKGDETDLTIGGFELIAQAVSIGVMRADAEWRRN